MKMQQDADRKIEIIRGQDTYHIQCYPGENLLEAMLRQGIYVSAACNGRGTCGKCKIQLLQGKLESTLQDRKHLSAEELKAGFRLSCRAYPREDCKVFLVSEEENDFDIIHNHTINKSNGPTIQEEYAIVVDIGTTTIAASLVGLTSGDILDTYTQVNKQRVYGADVISRIQASNNGKRKLLQNIIQRDLLESFHALMNKMRIDKKLVKRIAIAGNTTMGHLLMGYSCSNLGVYPFRPVNIRLINKKFQEMFHSEELDASVTLLPGISAFVGADIAAGLLVCNFDRTDIPCLFVDLGTNGEMAIGNKDRILVSSTAAGPAFEGGNISCGVGSILGAIAQVLIENSKDNVITDKTLKEKNNDNNATGSKQYQVRLSTIGNQPPIGICGTGVVEIVAELLKNGIIDETGLLESPYFEKGFPITEQEIERKKMSSNNGIVFTQKDVRELQLAKAAIRAGVETLLNKYGAAYDDIGNVYLAGGFGYRINIKKAISIGLLPKELSGKIISIGNSSLAGAYQYVTDPSSRERMERIISRSKEINLSQEENFKKFYLNYMNFEFGKVVN
jgi:uncharacterized 2Fe-2S/4Fe-4S cluster protein (DUF4445 family)